jgi:hypothetical protein
MGCGHTWAPSSRATPSPPLSRARVRHPVGLLRQALLADQRHADALPRPPRLPLRGLLHDVHVPTAPAGLHRLGIRPLPRAIETACRRHGTAVQDSTALVVFVFWWALCPVASLTDCGSLPTASAACASSIFFSCTLTLRVNPPSNLMALALVQGMIRRLVYVGPLANLYSSS